MSRSAVIGQESNVVPVQFLPPCFEIHLWDVPSQPYFLLPNWAQFGPVFTGCFSYFITNQLDGTHPPFNTPFISSVLFKAVSSHSPRPKLPYTELAHYTIHLSHHPSGSMLSTMCHLQVLQREVFLSPTCEVPETVNPKQVQYH